MANPHPVKVVAVTSGKGGVGKTNLSVNLSLALASLGREVMLMDADLGLANVDVLLGLTPKYNLSHVISGERTLEEILISGPNNVKIVPAASGTQRMAELHPSEHSGVIQAFSELSYPLDYLIIDTAAGISDSVVSFTRAAREVMVVVCDEPSSITDAYALIKVLNRDYNVQRFHVVANMVRTAQEGPLLFKKLSMVTEKFLDIPLDYMGAVSFDENIRKAVQKQKAILEMFPGTPAAVGMKQLAQKMERWVLPRNVEGHLEFFVERLIEYSVQAQAGGSF
ncbi:MAG: MinD/ParA family protein [Gammaproteobacteria bacterium]|nr:MAG: MinD/ParA family protein [Gammaproteobacteria bacterium]